MTTPICLWSGPRNVSTALMYSFAQRDDIRVVDEPLYGHYLRVSGADHPGRDAIIAGMNCDGAAVMRELLLQQRNDPSVRIFQKHMAHHLVGLDLGFLEETSNIFLIRSPRDMLPSLTVQLPHATLADTGLRRQWELYADLRAAGQTPAILDSRELLLDPAGILEKLCEHLGLDFDPRMLHWKAGPLAEDGIWAPHWYHAVHESTGFAPYRSKTGFPEELLKLLADCQPWYDRLYENALISSAPGET
ncbi:MAG: sulfotransferase [Gammaproteobacteria bacterium]|nr:sulfotransferase [Gammaproteobacteria bacterium]MDH3362806.1 sulfotransferase [Gammaproteobacteria bacterium]MDH3480519.1 sulfotransferase [Gammaproteobacteria bacterium]